MSKWDKNLIQKRTVDDLLAAMIRIGVLAPKLPKKRHSKNRNPADVDEYNNRQAMRCKETRRRFNPNDGDTVGPGGLRIATDLALVEIAIKHLPSLELAAYMAKEHMNQDEPNMLVDEMEAIISRAAKIENWIYYENKAKNQPRMLASIVVEEWLSPAKFWRMRDGELTDSPVIGSFASIMGCDRKTWHTTWKQHFHTFRGYPQRWYDRGSAIMQEKL